MSKAKKKKGEKSSVSKPKRRKDENDDSEANESFDFGGLPDRDIKKNLGCG